MRLLVTTLIVSFSVLGGAASSNAETVSKQVSFANDEWVKVNLTAEGIQLSEIRFKLEGGVHYNPLRAGKGPQCFVAVRNTSGHEQDFAIAVALVDAKGNLVGATESGHTGSLDPGETAEVKMTFREVHRRIYEAKTVHVTLETWK